jgi:alkaline phosphatase D
MKIAFTSCCDPWNDPIQAAWPELAKQKPDVLVLLGDNMYMDYGLGDNPLKLGESITLSPPDFASHMYENYKKQWKVPNFHQAISQIPIIHAIWDDHDFARNNGRGEGTICTCVKPGKCKCEYVTPVYREISRALFQQFRDALRTKPDVNDYPDNPYQTGTPTTLTGQLYKGIQESIELTSNQIKLHLLDGRSFRSNTHKTESLLGVNQKHALEAAFTDFNGIHLIASGTTLNDWSNYNDYDWLQSLSNNKKIIVLSGDVHQPLIQKHGRIFEFTASAMAQPAKITWIFGRESNVFGVLNINQNNIKTEIFQLRKNNTKLVTKKSSDIDIAAWELKGLRDYPHEYRDSD